MRKFILGLSCGFILAISTSVDAKFLVESVKATIFPAKIELNGDSNDIPDGFTILNYNNLAYVPARFIAEKLGATVNYNDGTKTISINQTEKGSDTQLKGDKPISLTETEAIRRVLHDESDFPTKSGETKTIDVYMNSPSGGKVTAKVSTTAERLDQETYIVTFTKEWSITVDAKVISRYWKYRVTPTDSALIESKGNDELLQTIK